MIVMSFFMVFLLLCLSYDDLIYLSWFLFVLFCFLSGIRRTVIII